MRGGHAHLFELKQLENTLWYLLNLRNISRMDDLLPIPEFHLYDRFTETEVYDRIANVKHRLTTFISDEIFNTGIQQEFYQQRLRWCNALVVQVDQSLGKDGVSVGMPSNKEFEFETEFSEPDYSKSNAGYSQEIHKTVHAYALQSHAYSWLCCLETIIAEDQMVWLPVAPPPIEPATGNLYSALESFAAKNASNAMRLMADNADYSDFVPRYSYYRMLRQLAPNIALIDKDLSESMKAKRVE